MTGVAHRAITEDDLWDALREIPDPELPAISLVDLGVILRVELDTESELARIFLMPTFLGCPALDMMRGMIRDRLEQLGLRVQVDVTREQLWSSDRISEMGRRQLQEAGIAPPGPADNTLIQLFEAAACPHCGSRRTTLESPFGPTPCRAITYCADCRQPFEQFKAV